MPRRPADILHPATDADLPAIEAFLARRPESSMFLRANLREHGLGEARAPRGTDIALARDGDRITGVFGLTNAGYGAAQAPEATQDAWQAFGDWIGNRLFLGLTADAAQVRAARTALRITDADLAAGRDEPLYRLDLAAMRDDGLAEGRLRGPKAADLDLLEAWFSRYEQETLGTAPERASALGRRRAAQAILEGGMRILEHAGTPLAMTAFNARLPDLVQIGGVFTPPEHRNRRAARTAVALHLHEARAEGVEAAILFAANAAAARAYEALGFRHIGHYGIAMFKTPRGQRNGPVDA